jgi:hypothetical protein
LVELRQAEAVGAGTIMVLTLGMSMPFSMIVEARRIVLAGREGVHAARSSRSSSWPCPP